MVKMQREVPHQGYQNLYEGTEDNVIEAEATSAETNLEVIEETQVPRSLDSVLHLDATFISQAKRGSAPLSPHKIVWFTGNNKCRDINGKPLPDIAGWAIEQPNLEELGLPEDFELWDAMELLCAQGIAVPVIVIHQDDAGKPRPVKYWALKHASLFVVCEGIPNKSEMLRDVEMRWGVAYAWPKGKGSSLHFYAFVKELMDTGYNYGFFIRMSSYCTDRMLACLKVHERTLNAADALRQKLGKVGVAYYAYALPLSTSQRTITAGKEVGKTTEVYYPVPMVPRKIDVDFLSETAITEDQAFILEEDGRVERMVEWSVEKSKRLIAGDTSDIAGEELMPGDYGVGGTIVDPDGNTIVL